MCNIYKYCFYSFTVRQLTMWGCKSAKSLYVVVEKSEVLFLPTDCASTGLLGMTTDTCGLFRNIADTYPFFLSSNFFLWKLPPPFPFSWTRENNVVTIVIFYGRQSRSHFLPELRFSVDAKRFRVHGILFAIDDTVVVQTVAKLVTIHTG